jgi:hypothetical protein
MLAKAYSPPGTDHTAALKPYKIFSIFRLAFIPNLSDECHRSITGGYGMKTEEAIATNAPTNEAPAPKKRSASKKAATPATKKAAKTTKPKRRAKTETKPASKKAAKDAERAGTKQAIVLELLRRPEGATIAEIAKATEWQAHSIRGFISGHVTKKMGLKVESSKNDAGERTYRLIG